jgi:glycosyltransferase involved in cell wall biosynthesis
MHIIVLENEPSSFRGGQELSIFEVCRALYQRGHKISLIYVREGNLLEQYREFCDDLIKINRYVFDRRKIPSIFEFLASIALVNWQIPARKDSILFSSQYHEVFFGSTLAFLKNTPFVCSLRIPPCDFNRQKYHGLKGVNQFIAISNQTKSDWVNFGSTKFGIKEDKVDVVYNGTNTEKFKPAENFSLIRNKWNLSDSTRVVSYAGRLDEPKGLETLIKAFALLIKDGISVKLMIAGKPLVHKDKNGKECTQKGEQYKQSLKQLSNDLGIEKYVEFLGHLTDTTSLYQLSDVTVLPSLWSEPFGRSIIESMACGTPVVASRIGGIPEILTGEFQRGLFEPGNERDLSDTLSQIINWRDINPQLGERCREHILNKFTSDRMFDGIEKALMKVIKK